MFSEKDAMQFREKGITLDQLEWQLKTFHEGIPFMKLNREAKVGDGIISLSDREIKEYIDFYEKQKTISVLKFVPASGAASRMFKSLYEYLEADRTGDKSPAGSDILTFFKELQRFAFFNELKSAIADKGLNLEGLMASRSFGLILETLLEKPGLNYGSLPKGLLSFHRSKELSRTPFEEHLDEGALYSSAIDNEVRLHFTVSPEHLDRFKELLDEKKGEFEKKYLKNFEVNFSIQNPSTDTMAVDNENKPFRNEDGSILFRPGGHGALIDNLNDLNADLIFIKNIDNVVPEKFAGPTIKYKKALAGILLVLQIKVFKTLKELETKDLDKENAELLLNFVKNDLCYEPKSVPDFNDSVVSIQFFKEILNRPIRVCGVVKNLGEPGGGPFWAPNGQGDVTLQIVESSQIDNNDPGQKQIFGKASHFNPVDLVCSNLSYDGRRFDLSRFIDKNTCFISYKSKDGKVLKALELPGLWNGAMANWITLFVEVPVETFNPVKTVNDLLRPQHQ